MRSPHIGGSSTRGARRTAAASARVGGGAGLPVPPRPRARGRPLPAPAAAMLMSPWLDVELTGESWITNAEKETLFRRKESVDRLTNMFLGAESDRRDPLV